MNQLFRFCSGFVKAEYDCHVSNTLVCYLSTDMLDQERRKASEDWMIHQYASLPASDEKLIVADLLTAREIQRHFRYLGVLLMGF